MLTRFTLVLLALFVGIFPALPLEGEKLIVLIGADGSELVVGRVTFTAQKNGTGFNVILDQTKFVEKFLSMRPFRCIDGKKQTICHLEYPYKTHKTIADDDLTDLEYELLFLHKGPGEYGINMWNGIYYKLTKEDDGLIRGVLMETDMNVLAVPPEDKYSRTLTDLTEGEISQHRYPRLEIR